MTSDDQGVGHQFDDDFDPTEASTDTQRRARRGGLRGALSGSGRALTLVIVIALVSLGGGVYLLATMLEGQPPPSQSRVADAPEAQGPPTGEDATPRYADRVRAENEQRTHEALEQGTSSVPTLVNEREMPAPPIRSGCDAKCQRKLRDAIAEAASKAETAEARAEKLEDHLDRYRRSNANEDAHRPERYRHQGTLYMTPGAEQQRRTRMRGEMQQIASVVTGLSGHGYAATQSSEAAATAEPSTDGGADTATAAGGGGTAEVRPTASDAGDKDSGSQGEVLINEASTLYTTLDMTANSDVPGPIRATIHQGPLTGARVLGSFEKRSDYLVLQFDSLTTPEGETYAIDAVAVDPTTRLAGMADEVDRHLLLKFAAIGGAAFLRGFGEAVRLAGQSVTVNTGTDTTITANDALESTGDKALVALGEVGKTAGEILRPLADRPTTVVKYANTGMALLFLDAVAEADRSQG